MAVVGQGDCSVCMQEYDGNGRFPMILECGHTFCKSCVEDPKIQRCPNCSSPINKSNAKKNFALVPSSEPRRNIAKLAEIKQPMVPWNEDRHNPVQQGQGFIEGQNREQLGIRCRNGHPTVWTGRSQQCWQCNRSGTGWKCDACKFHQCDLCSGTTYSSKMCPNGDAPEWFGRWKDDYLCLVCQKKKVCIPCHECNTTHCVDCRRCSKNKIRVCKIHKKQLTFRADKYCGIEGCLNQNSEICEICRARCSQHNEDFVDTEVFCQPDEAYLSRKECTKNGCKNSVFWRCSLCDLKLCNICGHTQMISDKCPNGHKTTWTGEKIKCAHCDTVRTGWKCAKCNYNLCDGCAEKGLITLVQEEDGKHCCSMM